MQVKIWLKGARVVWTFQNQTEPQKVPHMLTNTCTPHKPPLSLSPRNQSNNSDPCKTVVPLENKLMHWMHCRAVSFEPPVWTFLWCNCHIVLLLQCLHTGVPPRPSRELSAPAYPGQSPDVRWPSGNLGWHAFKCEGLGRNDLERKAITRQKHAGIAWSQHILQVFVEYECSELPPAKLYNRWRAGGLRFYWLQRAIYSLS